MLTVEEALVEVLRNAGPLPPTRLPLRELPGRILAEDVASDIDLPPFDKALMDGYAVRAADVPGPGTVLTIGEGIPAGRTPSRPLAAAEAAIIMTGAPLPVGADAVVPHERTQNLDPWAVRIETDVKAGMNWLPRAREMRLGDVVARAGTMLNPVHVGVLASVGRTDALVIPRPQVVIVPTGDELVEPNVRPGPGQIRNSHALMLEGLAGRLAHAEVTPIAPDDPLRLRERLETALDTADVVLVTGGVSAGARDLVPGTLADLGVETRFHKIRLKPGKPLLFGTRAGVDRAPAAPPTLVFGLPGNPVSGLVGFILFVAPVLRRLSGLLEGDPWVGRLSGHLDRAFHHRGDRPTYHPARVQCSSDGTYVIAPLEWAGSSDLRTAASGDGFAVFPEGDRDYAPGERIEFLPLGP